MQPPMAATRVPKQPEDSGNKIVLPQRSLRQQQAAVSSCTRHRAVPCDYPVMTFESHRRSSSTRLRTNIIFDRAALMIIVNGDYAKNSACVIGYGDRAMRLDTLLKNSDMGCPSPKGAADSDEFMVSLKRYPDTKPSFSTNCQAELKTGQLSQR